MPVSVLCPACGHVGKAPEQFTGQKVSCRRCGKAFIVETVVEPIILPDLPSNSLAVPEMAQLAEMRCPFCMEKILPGAIKCRHCGSTLLDQPTPAPPVTINVQADRKKTPSAFETGFGIGCGILTALILLPIAVLFVLQVLAEIAKGPR